MKRFSFSCLIGLVALTSCERDDEFTGYSQAAQAVRFALCVPPYIDKLRNAGMSNRETDQGSINSAPIPDRVVLTIKKGPQTLYDRKILQLFETDKGAFSECLLLVPGANYTLEYYEIEDERGQKLYAAPYSGQEGAKYVQSPLPLSFEITKKNSLQTLYPEVLPGERLTKKLGIDLSGWVYIPDDRFRSYLKGRLEDAFFGELMNPDDEGVKTAVQMDVSDNSVATLEGVQYFPDLEDLNCAHNALEGLNIGGNTELKKLNCSNDSLKALSTIDNDALRELSCSQNLLAELKVNPQLQTLRCQENQLAELDLSKNAQLGELDCRNNPLTGLDIRKLKKESDDEKLKIYGSKKCELRALFVHDLLKNHKEFKRVKRVTPETRISTFNDKGLVCADYDPINERCMDHSSESGEKYRAALEATALGTGGLTIAGALGVALKEGGKSGSAMHTARKVAEGASKWFRGRKSHRKESSRKKEEGKEEKSDKGKVEGSEKEEEQAAEDILKDFEEEIKDQIREAAEDQACQALSEDQQAACQALRDLRDAKTGLSPAGEKKDGKVHKKEFKRYKDTEIEEEVSVSSRSSTGESTPRAKKSQGETTSESVGKHKGKGKKSHSSKTKTGGIKKKKKRRKGSTKGSGESKKRKEALRERKAKLKERLQKALASGSDSLSPKDIKAAARQEGLRAHPISHEHYRHLAPRRRITIPRSTHGITLKSKKEPTGRIGKPKLKHKSEEGDIGDDWFWEPEPKKHQPQKGKPSTPGGRDREDPDGESDTDGGDPD